MSLNTRILLFLLVLSWNTSRARAIDRVNITPEIKEHIFTFGEFEYFEDISGKLVFEEISSPSYAGKFHENMLNYPLNQNPAAVYWYKMVVHYDQPSNHNYLLEFYNHGLEELTAYIPDQNGKYTAYHTGAKYDFRKRLFHHKNFEFWLPAAGNGLRTYYFSVKSSNAINIVVAHKTFSRFIEYALTEYMFFGLFYGLILLFSFYNLIIYLVVRERHYLYYILYLLAVGLYEVSTDGIAFQYIWPEAPSWNKYAFGHWLFLVSIFALLFAANFLQLKRRANKLYQLVILVIGLRAVYYLFCLFVQPSWFNYSIIELIPLTLAFLSGIHIWRKGYEPARFFVLAYTFLYVGFIAKLLVNMGYGWFIPGPLPHYSMSVGFIGEMIFLSLAIGDKVRVFKRNKETAQQQAIAQMEENVRLKDSVNIELEAKVDERTHVILEKSKEIQEKSVIIEQQVEELTAVNMMLQEQASEIARMNRLLETDNKQLQSNIKKVTHYRLMSAEVSFEEFSQEYPDREACFKFLSALKWQAGYTCKKCSNDTYWAGNLPYSRKCSKCKYDESVIVGTVLQNTRIPVNKALYIIFLVYSTKGKISSHKLSEIINIRQNTCWMYSSKIKKVMAERRKELQNGGERGWSKLLME